MQLRDSFKITFNQELKRNRKSTRILYRDGLRRPRWWCKYSSKL